MCHGYDQTDSIVIQKIYVILCGVDDGGGGGW